MKKKEAHDEAIYLIRHYAENWMYDVAIGCCEMAHGIGIISDKEYNREMSNIEKARNE